MKYLLHTDLGHDPDDAITIAFLLQHGYIPDIVGLIPGYYEQVEIANSIFNDFSLSGPNYYMSGKPEKSYHPGKHKIFLSDDFKCQYSEIKPMSIERALIIGPAKNLGNNLECEEMFFQGGYSPNSINPLEKFKDMKEVQSYNPSGAREDFKRLLASDRIKRKYYVGKNVCHGFTKADLQKIWTPITSKSKIFWDSLDDSKAMHDVLAAILFIDKEKGIWEQAKPVFNGLKMTTEPTSEEIYTLIGLK